MNNSLFEERVFISLGVPPAFDNSFRSSRYRSQQAAEAAIEAAMTGQPCLGEPALEVFLCNAGEYSQLCSFDDFKNLITIKKCFCNFKSEASLLSLVEEQAKDLWGECAMATLRRDFPDVDFLVVTEVGSPYPYLSEEALKALGDEDDDADDDSQATLRLASEVLESLADLHATVLEEDSVVTDTVVD